MTTLLLRADAGPSIGVGHLSRCVALAEAAVARGRRVVLAGDVEGAGWLRERLATLDVPVVRPAPLAAQAAELGADIVLVDHYGLGELPDVRAVARLVSMEDGRFGRRAADVVVDANLVAVPRPPDGSPVVLLGPDYPPLRADIAAARTARSDTPRSGVPVRVVVVMGGGAAGDAVATALTALRDTGVPMSVRAMSATPVEVEPGPDQRFTVQPPTPGLPALLAEADLVISAAGVTLMELCCVGVPAALVQLADNQAVGYAAAVGQGLAAGLGTVADLPAATGTLRALLLDPAARATLGRTAASVVDGRGAGRILDAAELTAREATQSDAALLLEWRNDPATLAASRAHEPVAEPVHRQWLGRTIADPDRMLLVVESDRPVGTVRFDRVAPDTWEASITVAPGERGRGLASRLLALGEGVLHARHVPPTLLANVREDNKPSWTLFANAGYRESTRPADGPFRWLTKPPPPTG